MTPVTILIVARNAAATIGRAVRSALAQQPRTLVLVDDASEDDTVGEALRAGGSLLTVERLATHSTVGRARNVALSHVATPFAVWLDADDELLPDRAARLVARLEAEHSDIATDAAELVDEATGTRTGESRLPPFLFSPPGIVRIFERNYLPVPGPIAFRTSALQPLGYDDDLQGAEDMDLLLRAISGRLRFSLEPTVGYRIHTAPTSLSRQLTNQRAMLRRALAKHAYADVERLYRAHGASDYVTGWGLVWLATFREDWQQALSFLDRVAALPLDPALVVEPDGPCPRRESWRQNFQRGTLLLMTGRPLDAMLALTLAEAVDPTAETANNLGVALSRIGRGADAHAAFARALSLWPGYLDARLNADAPTPDRVTTHPIRRGGRRDYSTGVLNDGSERRF